MLADFGVAANLDFSRRFTSAHRTILYAPPEAEGGEISPQFYWCKAVSSVQTIAELLVERHPFAGQSEAVASASLRLGTPPDLQAIWAAPELRKPLDWARLCRGLLQFERGDRGGADEVERWLKGETILPSASAKSGCGMASGEPEPRASRPYIIGERRCSTAAELAVAMRDNWDLACRDIARMNMLDAWLARDLGNQNAARWLHDSNT